ncbi:hypothetical protein JZ751_008706 [Albula glossodonta]|uniref:Adenosine deaminase domain-containing protein 1 n=1 Tax=Albula glossodonta TaxID=121402 RepID=A0A8T2P7G6_9TELE|nr:hypothetical protein JZ751_008706 [Albula glossodonta]
MISRGAPFRGTRGASFAQILKKNVATLPGLNSSYLLPTFPEEVNNNIVLHPATNTPSPQKGGKPAKSLPKELIERYKRGETHAVSALYQLSQALQFQLELKETVTTGNIQGFYFAFCAVIDGVEYQTGMGQNKKEARAKAAQLALEDLLPNLGAQALLPDASVSPPPLPVKEESSMSEFHSSRKVYVKEAYNKLMEGYPEFSSSGGTLAAFIIQSPAGCEVVAIGTGDFNTKESITLNGRILHDSHAVVTARRSLMRRLNPHSISAWEVNNQIGLHLSIEGKVFSVFSASFEQTASKVVSMSASDKLTQWQVLGFQGALLSHFIEPVYVSSILIGDASCSDVRGMEIAISQRVDGLTSHLPMYYCVYRPHINLVPAVCPPGPAPSSSPAGSTRRGLSINWSQGDVSLEAVDGLEGRALENSPFKSGPALASRLCKAAMLSRFNLVAHDAQRPDLLAVVSYREAKMMAKPYQEAKNVLKSYLLQKGYGSWLMKSPISDHFRAGMEEG